MLDVLWRGDAGDTAARRVAFAVGRQVGTAVVRNRVKRRLRAALVELERADDPRFTPGDYLVRAHRGADQLSYAELRDQLVSALDRAATRRSGAGR